MKSFYANKLKFRSLITTDIPIIHRWFNLPHVQKFYSLRSWSKDEVTKKVMPTILGEKAVFPFLIFYQDKPIAYIQYYAVQDFPWPNQDFTDDVVQYGAGIDQFIGEPDYLGRGFGTEIIKVFLQKIIWQKFDYCIVDPDVNNKTAIHCYEKLGFLHHKVISFVNAIEESVQLDLMLLTKESFYKLGKLKENIQNIDKEKEKKWLNDLPNMIELLCAHWQLTQITPVDNMSYHFVAKAKTQTNEDAVLKIGFDKKSVTSEKEALLYFNGHGMVRLLDYHAQYHAMLLQQAIPGYSLRSIYPKDFDIVVSAYCDVMKILHNRPEVSHPNFPHISDWLIALDNVDKWLLPPQLVDQAITLKNSLLSSSKNETLLHGDLHLDNILRQNDGWIVIDPKGVIGEAEFEAAAFDFIHPIEMNNIEVKSLFLQRATLLSLKSQLDLKRLTDWVFVRLVLSAVWAIEDDSDPSWALKMVKLLYE